MRLDIEFADGRVGATADGAAGVRLRPDPVKRRARRYEIPGQGSLF
jgi:hypothetical protein